MTRVAALLLLTVFATGQAMAAPQRIMSLNLCTDQLLLLLVPPERIVSVTGIARDPRLSRLGARADTVATNRGTAEEVLRDRPDLILAGPYSTPTTRAMLRRLGAPLVEIDEVSDIAGIRRITREVAAAVGERARGEALIVAMDRRLATLRRLPPLRARVAAWDGAGLGARPGSLHALLIETAGATNIAGRPPLAGRSTPDAELLLAAAPDLIVQADDGPDRVGRQHDVARHPVIRARWAGRTVRLSPADHICGTPLIAEAARGLRARMTSAVGER